LFCSFSSLASLHRSNSKTKVREMLEDSYGDADSLRYALALSFNDSGVLSDTNEIRSIANCPAVTDVSISYVLSFCLFSLSFLS
jgi:hypothetical protein